MEMPVRAPALIEPWPVQDVFASGRIREDYGAFVRLLFYRDWKACGVNERQLVASIIMERQGFNLALRDVAQDAIDLVLREGRTVGRC